MNKFEVISKYSDKNINLPIRATAHSAGYDFEAAEKIIVPSYKKIMEQLCDFVAPKVPYETNELKQIVKMMGLQPTLIPTGIKCHLDEGYYLELAIRSSTPLNNWMILANGEGIIDGDYYNNPDNEGHIMFQIINLSPVDQIIEKGTKIGQGIIKQYFTTENDIAKGTRTGGFGSTNE